MSNAFSKDLRIRVIAHHKKTGHGRIRLARLFDIGSATAYRWVKEAATLGKVEAKTPIHSGSLPKIRDEDFDLLKQVVAEKPDRTLKELCAIWLERTNVLVRKSTMQTSLLRAGISLKKRRSAPMRG